MFTHIPRNLLSKFNKIPQRNLRTCHNAGLIDHNICIATELSRAKVKKYQNRSKGQSVRKTDWKQTDRGKCITVVCNETHTQREMKADRQTYLLMSEWEFILKLSNTITADSQTISQLHAHAHVRHILYQFNPTQLNWLTDVTLSKHLRAAQLLNN